MRAGSGILPLVAAAVLLRETPETIRRWAFGYARTRPQRRVEQPPLIGGETPSVRRSRELTFLELVELMFIKGFRKAGVSWHAIHEAARVAARIFQSEHPFAMRQFFADPKGVYALLRDADEGESLVKLAGHGQQVFDALVRPYLGQLEFDPMEVPTRWWPMGKAGRVLVDPAVSFGHPIVAEAGIPTRALAEAVEAEQGYDPGRAMERVSWLFRVPPRHVQTAVRFEEWLRAA